MATQTVKIQPLKDFINSQLARTDKDATDEFKIGQIEIIEKILRMSKNYMGYTHIYWENQGADEWKAAGKPEGEAMYKYTYGNLGKYARRYY